VVAYDIEREVLLGKRVSCYEKKILCEVKKIRPAVNV
jgi:hypothetical protein